MLVFAMHAFVRKSMLVYLCVLLLSEIDWVVEPYFI